MSAPSPGPSGEYAQRVRAALKTRCVFLKTKEAYLGLPGPGSEEGRYDTAIWWCERTCQALGPDGAAALPRDCERAGRACYEPPLRPRS